MTIAILIGVVIFAIVAGIIISGYQQMKAQHLNQMKDRIMKKYSLIRERQYLFDSLPGAYFPQDAQEVIINDIIYQLDKILTFSPDEKKAKMMLREHQALLENVQKGSYRKDDRKAQSLAEAENVHKLAAHMNKFIFTRYQLGLLSHKEMLAIHQNLEQANARATLDGELCLASNALTDKKLQSAYYHFDRVLRSLEVMDAKEGEDHQEEIAYVKEQMTVTRKGIEEKGEKVYDPSEAGSGSKAWDNLMEEEAKYDRDNIDLED